MVGDAADAGALVLVKVITDAVPAAFAHVVLQVPGAN